MAQSEYFSEKELKKIGFSKVGKHSQVSRKASFYRISGRIGDHVRIDDFCILKGHVEIGSHVHIAAFCSVSGAWDKVRIGDFVALSNRVSVFTGSNDYSASTLNNIDDEKFSRVLTGPVTIGIGVLVGAHSVVLPGVEIGDGASVASMCVVAKSAPPGGILRSQTVATLHPDRKRDVKKVRALAKEYHARQKKK